MERKYVLNFTYEIGKYNKLLLLDVELSSNKSNFVTKVYRKPTDKGWCLNANSECPELYKKSVIKSLIMRAP